MYIFSLSTGYDGTGFVHKLFSAVPVCVSHHECGLENPHVPMPGRYNSKTPVDEIPYDLAKLVYNTLESLP